MSVSLAIGCGINENRTRVRPRGPSSSSSRLTYFVAKLALAVGWSARSCSRSATLSLILASAEQSLFSPMS